MKRLMAFLIVALAPLAARAGGQITPEVIVSSSMQIPHSATPPLYACKTDADRGKIYIDTNAPSGQQFYACEGAAGWKLQGGTGGGTFLVSPSTGMTPGTLASNVQVANASIITVAASKVTGFVLGSQLGGGSTSYAQINPATTQVGGIKLTSATFISDTNPAVLIKGPSNDYFNPAGQLRVNGGDVSFGNGAGFLLEYVVNGATQTAYAITATEYDNSSKVRAWFRNAGSNAIAYEITSGDGFGNRFSLGSGMKLDISGNLDTIYTPQFGNGIILDPHVDFNGNKRQVIFGAGEATMTELLFDGSSTDGSILYISTASGGGLFRVANPMLFLTSATVAGQFQANTLKLTGLPGAGPLAIDSTGAVSTTTASVGTITGVTAGTGLTGGGTSGTVTLNVDPSTVTMLGPSIDLSGAEATGILADARFPATLPAASGVNLTALNASNLGSGTVPNARIDSSSVTMLGPSIDLSGAEAVGVLAAARFPALTGDVTTVSGAVATTIANVPSSAIATSSITKQGNTFNGASQLVQTTAGGALPALSATNLTSVPAGNLTGTVPNSTIDASSITKQGNTFNGNSQLVQTTSGGILPALSGANLTALNATQLTSGTVPNAQIDSSSVTKLGPTITLDEVLGGSAGANNYDFSSATYLRAPSGTNPTIDASGKFGVDTSSGQFVFHDGTNAVVLPSTFTQSIVIQTPAVGDFPFFWRPPTDVTVTSLVCISSAATSASIEVDECDANGANCATINTITACTTTNTALPITDSAIAALNRIRVKVTAVSGTPGWVSVDMYYRETRK